MTGGGVETSRFQQLLLLARSRGVQEPADWAAFAWRILAAQGHRVVKDGAVLESADECLAELTVQAGKYATATLPILQALQVV